MAEQMTLRKLIQRLKDRGDDIEQMMDVPLWVGVRDPAGNFERERIMDDWPHTSKPTPKTEFVEAYEGELRLDVHIDRFMRKAKAGQ